jgi:Tol biopolymer transport system component
LAGVLNQRFLGYSADPGRRWLRWVTHPSLAGGSRLRFAAGTLFAASLAVAPNGAASAETAETETSREREFLTRVRQLSFEGRRAGEGYYSPDGKRLVFQSEREPGNPFYQIYELNLETGDTRRISTGAGKTTCAFYHPTARKALFASTHHDPRSAEMQRAELELRASGEEQRYAWDYDPEMEIYVANLENGELQRLTEIRGYDAEGSYSPDGRWIVFASTRDAYGRELGPEERRRLELDPSYFAEIYLMRADGSEQRRLTDKPGYDGGPFFSAEGDKVIWRRFDAEGLIADIWDMNLDGSNKRQLTDFASMSWAPYPHPSGEYIFFTSNKLGFENFELFIVDREGRKEPVRVTYTEGFDGLPVPSPDGVRLAWTSTRRQASDKGQLFLGDWNHERALEALREATPRATASGEREGR